MSWFRENKSSWMQSLCVKVLRAGPIPKHVAIIMDGNRRYARKQHLEKVEGHSKGFEKLAETLQWCNDLGINQVTVYAFSIENFKRSKEEVDGLMSLAKEKIMRLLEEKDKVMEYGVCIRVFGNLKLLPKDIQKLTAEVVLLSRNNTNKSSNRSARARSLKWEVDWGGRRHVRWRFPPQPLGGAANLERAFLNICLAYTSREEICNAVNEVSDGVYKGLIEPDDINENVLEKCLYSSQATDPDLLIRTSGEVRLSDFLLWQSTYSVLAFVDTLWPEFSFWHMCYAVLYYQLNCQNPEVYKRLAREECCRVDEETDCRKVYNELFERESETAECTRQLSSTKYSHFKKRKEERVSTFIRYVEDKRLQELQNMASGC